MSASPGLPTWTAVAAQGLLGLALQGVAAPCAGCSREEPCHGSRGRCTAGVPSALAQLSALVQQPPSSNPASISHSPFASHPWSYNSLSSLDMAHTDRTASLPDNMPALPAPLTLVKARPWPASSLCYHF